MSELSKYEAYKKKLEGLCDEHNLVAKFKKDKYPVAMTVRPLTGLDEQISMMENIEENGYTSPDACITFTMKDCEVDINTSETFTISDTLFKKLLDLFKKMHFCWVQYFFRDVVEKRILTEDTMPKADDEDDLMAEAEPLEVEELDEDDVEVDSDDYSDLISKASEIVRQEGTASLSLLQRRLDIGLSKAARVMDTLEEQGVVGPKEGTAPREVYYEDFPEDDDAPDLDDLGVDEHDD